MIFVKQNTNAYKQLKQQTSKCTNNSTSKIYKNQHQGKWICQILQVQSIQKINQLEVSIQPIIALTQLFQIQRELRYKKQKYEARKQMMQTEHQQRQYIDRNQVQSAILTSPRTKKQQIFQTNVISIVIQPKKQLVQQLQHTKPKNKNLEIPLYRSKNESNQNKLDRISKYIASLKRNMKLNSQTLGYKWKIKQFLLEDQNYLELRKQLEMHMMREEELDSILAKGVEKGIKQYIKKAQIVESNQQYKLIKIYKNIKQNLKTQQNKNNNITSSKSLNQQQTRKSIQAPNAILNPSQLKSQNLSYSQAQFTQPIVYNSPRVGKIQQKRDNIFTSPFIKQNRFTSPLKKLSKIQIQQKAEQDFKSIKKELQKSNQSYIQMLSKINQTVEKGSQKLIQLRQKRKKKFQTDDNIWDQLDKI